MNVAATSRGQVVLNAQDELAALRVPIDTRPHVIIPDVNMPQLAEPDAVQVLKAWPGFRRIAIIRRNLRRAGIDEQEVVAWQEIAVAALRAHPTRRPAHCVAR
jgi:CheY-like chemotaxis protein